jgi:hypothetical protein
MLDLWNWVKTINFQTKAKESVLMKVMIWLKALSLYKMLINQSKLQIQAEKRKNNFWILYQKLKKYLDVDKIEDIIDWRVKPKVMDIT